MSQSFAADSQTTQRTFTPASEPLRSSREIFLLFPAQLPQGRDYGTSDVPLWLLQTSVR